MILAPESARIPEVFQCCVILGHPKEHEKIRFLPSTDYEYISYTLDIWYFFKIEMPISLIRKQRLTSRFSFLNVVDSYARKTVDLSTNNGWI